MMTSTIRTPLHKSFLDKVSRSMLPPEMAAFFMAGALPPEKWRTYMQFFRFCRYYPANSRCRALGAGLAVWGVVNLLEGYGSDNAGAKSQGMKQLMAN